MVFNMYTHVMDASKNIRTVPLLFLAILFLLLSTNAQSRVYKRDAVHGEAETVAADSQPKPEVVAPSSSVNEDSGTQKLNCSSSAENNTLCKTDSGNSESDGHVTLTTWENMSENTGALKRTLYVTLGLTGVVVIYFVVRGVLLRRKRTKSRKYGIIAQQGDRGDMEMEPLGDGDDDDDDYTVFELNERKK